MLNTFYQIQWIFFPIVIVKFSIHIYIQFSIACHYNFYQQFQNRLIRNYAQVSA